TTNNADVCATGKTSGIKYYNGRPSMRAGFCKSPDTAFKYTWAPSTFLQDSTFKSPLAYLNKTIEYFVTTTGGSDCMVEDSVTITVPIHDYDIYPKDTSICFGQDYELIAAGTPSSVQWYEYDPVANTYTIAQNLSCDGCADP